MAQTFNKIAKVRKLRKMSQQELADAVGAHVITISNLERGQAPLTTEWLERLSTVLHCEEGALLEMERPTRIFVAGELNIHGVDFWLTEGKYEVAYARPMPISAEMPIWIIVTDDSFYPMFRNRDAIRLIPMLPRDPKELKLLENRLCLAKVETHDFGTRTVVGYVRPNSYSGNFSIDIIGGVPIIGAEVVSVFLIDRTIYNVDVSMTTPSEN